MAYKYGGYRGRKTLNDILKLVAIVLGVLVVLGVAGLFLGSQFLVFTDEGVRWPWTVEKTPGGVSGSEPGDVSVTVDVSGSGSGSQSGSQSEPTGPARKAIKALELPVSAVLDGTASQQLAAAGADAAVFTMKDAQGMLGFASEQPGALTAGASSPLPGINEALTAWNQGDVYTVARVCCFRDNSLPYFNNGMALRGGGGNWRDELGLRWLSPDVPEVRAYLAGLCGELAALGFDEIVLENCAFPFEGNLDFISQTGSYVSGQFTATVDAFLDEIQAALAPYETRLSIRAVRANFDGSAAASGLSLDALESRFDRFWMAEDAEVPALPQLLRDAGVTDPESRMVTLVLSLSEGTGSSRAVLAAP